MSPRVFLVGTEYRMTEHARDPWAELTPGALGRLALHADAATCAEDLLMWGGQDAARLARWFRALASTLDPLDTAPSDLSRHRLAYANQYGVRCECGETFSDPDKRRVSNMLHEHLASVSGGTDPQ